MQHEGKDQADSHLDNEIVSQTDNTLIPNPSPPWEKEVFTSPFGRGRVRAHKGGCVHR